MLWRVSACVLAVAAAAIGIFVFAQSRFGSGAVVDKTGRFAIQISDLEFSEDYTEVDLRVSDLAEHPDFSKFRTANIAHFGGTLLIPKSAGRSSVLWKYPLDRFAVPTIIDFPGPDNTEHEATIVLRFKPLIHQDLINGPVPASADIETLWIKFEDFAPLKVERSISVPRSDSALGAVDWSFVESISPGLAEVLIAFGFTLAVASFPLLVLFLKRRKRLKLLSERPFVGKIVDGEVRFVEERNGMKQGEILLPKSWDPDEVGIQFRNLKNRPNVLRVFVDSIVTRFVTGQDDRVAQRRIAFLKTKIEELKLSKELQGSLDELEFRQINLDIKRLELETQKDGLATKKDKQHELTELEHQRDTLKLKVEMAQLEKQMRDFQDPKYKEPERSPGEVKKDKRDKLQKELDHWNAEEDRVKADTAMREDDRRRWLNMIGKKKDELYDQMEKAL